MTPNPNRNKVNELKIAIGPHQYSLNINPEVLEKISTYGEEPEDIVNYLENKINRGAL